MRCRTSSSSDGGGREQEKNETLQWTEERRHPSGSRHHRGILRRRRKVEVDDGAVVVAGARAEVEAGVEAGTETTRTTPLQTTHGPHLGNRPREERVSRFHPSLDAREESLTPPYDATATGGEGETDSEDAQATTGSKRKSPSGAQTAEDAASHAQVRKRPRPGAGKLNAIEEIVNKLTDKTERMFQMLLTRLNESDAQRNAQYVEQSGSAGVAQVVNVPAILNRGRSTNATRTGAGGTHGQSCPPQHLCTTMMAASRKSRCRRIVWQWNCRGFNNKKATMVPYMKMLSKNKLPDVVALQEPYDRAQLPGYVTCGPSYECTGRNIREVDEESDVDHIFIEILPSREKRVTGLFVLNVYSTPSKRGLRHTFDDLFREAMARAASAPLLICGDFNAPHTQWGYGADSAKGKKLARLVDDFGWTVLNEPASHARIGQGACRDTSPDLSIWSGAGAVAWSNSFEDLGSDHTVLCVTVGEDVCLKARIVDWEQFRKNRQDNQEGPIEDNGEWCRGLLADVERVTKEFEWTDWRQEPPKEGDRSSAGGGDGGVVDARRLGVCVTTREGTQIPTVSKIRVLGLWLQEDGANRDLVAGLQKKVAAATHLWGSAAVRGAKLSSKFTCALEPINKFAS
ncbi:hypothetical protein HPB50_001567 [Hyalomma asiaticum]|uniref:Uncharacterized protein n=1 Tax=Hyalomma asiaticum TaxID=266040 RepID=A0ACB7RTM2_HYAAI|nr:hypothetical protein HPB50_001567 [Hyalomma asiaticum]